MSKGGRLTPSIPAPLIATRLDAEAIKIGAQTSEVRIGGSKQSLSMTEAVIRKLFETAMKGSPLAQKSFLDLVDRAERLNNDAIDTTCDRSEVYRDAQAKLIAAAEARGVVAIARDDDTTFGILHSSFHELWSLALGGWHGVGNDPQYTPSLGFETFPFPEGLSPNIQAAAYAAEPRAIKIAAAAARLNELRENWLNPPDLVKRVQEVVPGYPERILPISAEAEAVLKKRTLTNLYNAKPAWLAHAHKTLDDAVAEAYGWGDDFRVGKLTDDEILARLFRLNQERSGESR